MKRTKLLMAMFLIASSQLATSGQYYNRQYHHNPFNNTHNTLNQPYQQLQQQQQLQRQQREIRAQKQQQQHEQLQQIQQDLLQQKLFQHRLQQQQP